MSRTSATVPCAASRGIGQRPRCSPSWPEAARSPTAAASGWMSIRPERPIVSTSCTCPLEADCKHVVATLLAANRLAGDSTVPRQAAGGEPDGSDAASARASGAAQPPAGEHCSRRRRRSAPRCRPPWPWAWSFASASGADLRSGRPSASRAHRRGACTSSAPTCWWGCARSSAARAATPGSRAPSRGRQSAVRAPVRARAGALVHRAVQHRPRHAPVRVVLRRVGVGDAR